ncbi:MAG: N-6 DNA methylase [Pseudomonadota bacterium]|nr:N-6 DNA methylase [Pseudomonadota bacterium]
MKTPIRQLVDDLWEEFWRAGVTDPTVILEQLLYLLFLRQVDRHPETTPGQHFSQHSGAGRQGAPLSWGACSVAGQTARFDLLGEQVFPWLRCLGGQGGSYARHLKNARFSVPTAAALAAIMQRLDQLPYLQSRHGAAAFDFVTGKLAGMHRHCLARDPRRLARQMVALVALVAPVPGDVIGNPGCGAGGLMVAAAQYLAQHFPQVSSHHVTREHYHHRMFSACDHDPLMLRVACLRMLLQGVKNPDIFFSHTTEPYSNCVEGSCSVVLAHPWVRANSCDSADSEYGPAVARTVLHCARMLRPGGRAAVAVPRAVLQGSSDIERAMRRMLLAEQRLDAVIPLAHTGMDHHASILLFTRTDGISVLKHDWRLPAQRDTTRVHAARLPLRPARCAPAQPGMH